MVQDEKEIKEENEPGQEASIVTEPDEEDKVEVIKIPEEDKSAKEPKKTSFGKVLTEDKERDANPQWYVIHTYSGYEDQVADSLKQRIESLDMKDKIFDIVVPKEKQIEIKGGRRKKVEKKIFPGYVLVKMVMTKNSWYVVRNTQNVTGFIGTGTDPVPISEDEVEIILKRMGVEEPKYKIDLAAGDPVRINDGPFKDMDAVVSDIDQEKGKIKVLVSIFGRETPVEVDFLQVKKI
jgi:transcription termination/antitermination protein NusG